MWGSSDLIYEIDYVLSNILQAKDSEYILDHDFAFTERPGLIEKFSLSLTYDPVWGESAYELTRNHLSPGQGVVVTLPLHFNGESQPTGVQKTIDKKFPIGLGLLLLAFMLYRFRVYWQHEKLSGHYLPLPSQSVINESWLK